jgi:hypothetical protein
MQIQENRLPRVLGFIAVALVLIVVSLRTKTLLDQKSGANLASEEESTSSPVPLPTDSHYWMSNQQFDTYLAEMGIASIGNTNALGRATLSVDWGETGRMIALGFENYVDRGSAWGALNIVSATHDFSVGAEYDTFAKKSDYDKLVSGESKGAITVDGVQGLVNYDVHYFFGTIQKVVVFPFKDGYVAFVYRFHEGEHNTTQTVQELYTGKYPTLEAKDLKTFDELVSSVKFSKRQ